MFDYSKVSQKEETPNSYMTTLQANNHFPNFCQFTENQFASTLSFSPSKQFLKYASRPPLPKKTLKNLKNTPEKTLTTHTGDERQITKMNSIEKRSVPIEKQIKQFSQDDDEFQSFELSEQKLKKVKQAKNFASILNRNRKQILLKQNISPIQKIETNNILIRQYQNSDFFNDKKQLKKDHQSSEIGNKSSNHDHNKSGGICFDIDLAQFTNNTVLKAEKSRKAHKVDGGSLRQQILIGKRNAKQYDKRTKALIFGIF